MVGDDPRAHARKPLLGRVLAALLRGLGLLLLWGLLEPYALEWRRYRVILPNLPRSWQGREVALIADLQVGMWLSNTATVRRAVQRLVRERPALVLIAGDFIYDEPEHIPRVIALLRPLAGAGLPVYAVLGNHDYAMPDEDDMPDMALAETLRRELNRIGVRVLENEAVALPAPDPRDPPLYLVGIGAHTPSRDNPERALSGIPAGAPRLVMMHHPHSFDALPPGSAPLAVAGHTHGGQLRLPWAPLWSYLTYTRSDGVYVSGWVDERQIEGFGQPGNRLYVNRGIGFSVIPLRFACPPEVTVFTLETSS